MYVKGMETGKIRIETNSYNGHHSFQALLLLDPIQGRVTHKEASAIAAPVAAQWPKTYGVKPSSVTESGRDYTTCWPTVTVVVRFHEDGVQGRANETGAKRVASFLRKTEQLGYEVEWQGNVTRDDFLAFVGGQAG